MPGTEDLPEIGACFVEVDELLEEAIALVVDGIQGYTRVLQFLSNPRSTRHLALYHGLGIKRCGELVGSGEEGHSCLGGVCSLGLVLSRHHGQHLIQGDVGLLGCQKHLWHGA